MRPQRSRQTRTSQGGEPAPNVIVVPAPDGNHEPARGIQRQDVDAFTMRLIGRYGTAENALTHLAGEQLKYRRRAQDAESELDRLQKQLPTAGSVVLSGDEAKAYNELKGGNATFSLTGVGAQLKELGQLKDKASRTDRETALATAAGKKYKQKVLAMAIGDRPLEFKTILQKREDGEEGVEEVKVPYIKNGDTLESLDTWLEREHKDILESLKASPDSGTDTSAGASSPGQSPGATMPKQTPSSSSASRGKNDEVFKVVDKQLSIHMTPGQRKKAAGA